MAGLALAAAMGIQAISSFTSGVSQAQAIESQGRFQKSVSDINSKIADFQARESIRQGEEAVSVHQNRTRQLIGAQRASLAAQGIDVESGSALQIQDSTRFVSDQDARTIRMNAYKQAFGFRTQAILDTMRGEFSEYAARNAASNTLLTGLMQGTSYALQGAYYGAQGGKGKGSGGSPGGGKGAPFGGYSIQNADNSSYFGQA